MASWDICQTLGRMRDNGILWTLIWLLKYCQKVNNIGKDEQGNTNKLLRFPSPLEYAFLYTEENGFDPKTEHEGKGQWQQHQANICFPTQLCALKF